MYEEFGPLQLARHTFASLLIDAGVNAKAVQEFMGHSTITMPFGNYGHLLPGSRDEVRERMDAYLERAANVTIDEPREEAAGDLSDRVR